MRFSIRDLLWATLVVAMGLGLWLRYKAMDAERRKPVEIERVEVIVDEPLVEP